MNARTLSALLTFASLAFLSLNLSSCLKDKCQATQTFTEYQPVYVLPEDLRLVTLEDPRPLETTGKIYTYQDLLLINEPYLGIHFFDNSDPGNPVPLSFLSVPGNVDMAIRNDILYADGGPDLLSFSLAEPGNPRLLHREEGVFRNFYQDTDLGILLYLRPTENTLEVPCGQPDWQDEWIAMDGGFFRNEAVGLPNALPAQQTGTGGSLARFTILDNWLYTVDQEALQVFSLADAARPSPENTVFLGWGIETIFPYGNHLFLGAIDGMHIMNATHRAQPFQQSIFRHARACDPVFVTGNRAYVTLRDGTECQNFINQLDVVDISNLDEPVLLETFPMHHPIGLSVVEDWLYLCEDEQGLKVFDRSSLDAIRKGPENTLSGLSAIDIIALPGKDLAIVIGQDGLHQYDISDRVNPVFLSLISVQRP